VKGALGFSLKNLCVRCASAMANELSETLNKRGLKGEQYETYH